MRESPLISFYGDDLTGSTDAMEALALAGIRTVLFLDPAGADLLSRFADCQAIGLAGTSRSESPAWMDRNLPAVFRWLHSLGARICHYKVCSTFDSSPTVGNIGRAIEIAQPCFGQDVVPVVIGAPQLRRFTFFGQLYAAFRDSIYRIDEHPVMSRHPVTPMHDADLCRHLRRQTAMTVDLLDWRRHAGPQGAEIADQALDRTGFPTATVFDVFDLVTQEQVARALLRRQARQEQLFVVGSSGVEYGLVPLWRERGEIHTAPAAPAPGEVDRIAVVSGSCSATTARQIRWAGEHGYALFAVDAARMSSAEEADDEEQRVYAAALAALQSGRSVIACSALGPDSVDVRAGSAQGADPEHRLSRHLGRLLRRLVESAGLRRAVIAGGDTSSHALRELEIQALTVAMPLPQTPGSPLCRAHARTRAVDGLEIALKGGQVGGDDYFEVIRRGSLS